MDIMRKEGGVELECAIRSKRATRKLCFGVDDREPCGRYESESGWGVPGSQCVGGDGRSGRQDLRRWWTSVCSTSPPAFHVKDHGIRRSMDQFPVILVNPQRISRGRSQSHLSRQHSESRDVDGLGRKTHLVIANVGIPTSPSTHTSRSSLVNNTMPVPMRLPHKGSPAVLGRTNVQEETVSDTDQNDETHL